jgi:alanine racemase
VKELFDNHPRRYFSAIEVTDILNHKDHSHQDVSVMLSHLAQWAEEDKIERTPMNHFRQKSKPKNALHLAPHIAAILKKSGKDFGGIIE